MNSVYLMLGSNLSDPQKQLQSAVNLLSSLGVIENQSSIYQTEAWGNPDQPDFLNQVLVVQTKLGAYEILKEILNIELAMGRLRSEKNAPREIDIDILFFNNEVYNDKDLIIPHPAIPYRRFVLEPLNEVSPGLIHPVLEKNVAELLEECTDSLNVKRF